MLQCLVLCHFNLSVLSSNSVRLDELTILKPDLVIVVRTVVDL